MNRQVALFLSAIIIAASILSAAWLVRPKGGVEGDFESLEKRIDNLERDYSKLEGEIDDIRNSLDGRLDDLESDLTTKIDEIEEQIE